MQTPPHGGANTPVFDIDLKNPGIALQAVSEEMCVLSSLVSWFYFISTSLLIFFFEVIIYLVVFIY